MINKKTCVSVIAMIVETIFLLPKAIHFSTSLLFFMLFLQTMEGHSNAVICMVVANRLMYTGGADASARCWVTEFGDCTRHYKGHKHSVICMKFDKGVCMCAFLFLIFIAYLE